MILTITPVTVGDTTTDKAILNMSVGDNSVAISLFPAVEAGGSWQRLADAPVLPIVGMAAETDVAAMLAAVEQPLQTLVDARGI